MTKTQNLQYFVTLILFRIISLLPLKVLYIISNLIKLVVYNTLGYRKKIVYENLHNAFPEKDDHEIDRIADKYYSHLSAMMVEDVFLRFATIRNVKKRVIVENAEVINRFHQQGKSVIVMASHTGNWEFGTALDLLLQHQVVGVYKQLSSPSFDKIFYDIRERYGSIPVEMKDIVREMLRLRRKDNPYALFMGADQSPSSSQNNHWINFLNQDTSVFLGSEKLAKKFDMPVVYMEIVRRKKGVYHIVFQNMTEKPKETADYEITEKYFKMLEESIKKDPSNWLWSHRRWKHKKVDVV